MASENLWAGRFRESLAEIAHRFSSSIALDGRLYREDIAGSIAHVRMLGATGVLAVDEAARIATALEEIRGEIERGELQLDARHEDVHMAIEGRLIEKLGPGGGALHTARSRNDQVALDERLYLRSALDRLADAVTGLQRALVKCAEEHAGTLMPGYTHTQRAQPVLLAHHLLAYASMFDRDRDRMLDCRRRANRSPLGAAALAGTSFAIDRMMVAGDLGFDGIVENSIDAVSDRDYIIEAVAACSITMMHLSRIAEDLVLWSTPEFGFVTIGDAFTTGSSIMPQKKNPDMAELVRGRTGRVYGSLISLLTMMKGLPLAYNRDMQEDKGPMFEAIDTTYDALAIMAPMLASSTFHGARMASQADAGFSLATEVADYLVRKGIPFREAHHITGRVVAHCVEVSCALHDLDPAAFRTFSPLFDDDIAEYLRPATSIALKGSAGSTAPAEVERQLAHWRGVLGARP
ncbi:MAG TPA: argininosuccinate lyase [Candidatus Kapabacteria bacterium]|nr:argininosuccinate lyase [Candidatus Kapabacteria bacterium]